MKKNPHAVALGRLGREAMTDAQAAASRGNGAKGGRPPNPHPTPADLKRRQRIRARLDRLFAQMERDRLRSTNES